MQGAPISSWIAAKENKPRLGNQAGFYFVCYLAFANHPIHFSRFISSSAMLLFSQRLLASSQHITHYA
ncbi:hypothetical protein CGK13_09820 [Vibrio parahaemolyticus]|nr:hypothetical protein CGK13_09820 [Vibrio parahaemolyticus]TOQ13916.1 hypothetical protein CGH04_05325 [Vibrio parahaemolyticus]